jgi:transposase InsO family protein
VRAAEGLRAADYAHRVDSPSTASWSTRSSPSGSAKPTRGPRAATAPRGSTPSCAAKGYRHGRSPGRFQRTTIPDPAVAERADLIRRDFAVDAAAVNTRWCGDITSIPTWEGWPYLATVIDIASRRVVGFALAEHLPTELACGALTNAVAARDPAPGVIFHADRGCQDTSRDDAQLAGDFNMRCRPVGPGSAGTTHWLNRSSPRSRARPGPAALADPSWGPPRHRGLHRLVQRHPAAQRPWLPDPDEFESITRKEVTAQAA